MKYNDLVNLLKNKGLLVDCDSSDKVYQAVYYDSRKILGDGVFVCKGLNFKKEYLENAIEKGVSAYLSEVDYHVGALKLIVNDVLEAMAVISEAIYDDKTKQIKLIGVTGTKGKTTTADFIHNILDSYTGKKNAYWTTVDHFTGKSSDSSHNTTPESVDLYSLIKDAKEENLKYCVLEVSSQASKLKRIATLNFDVGVFVNISYDHISYLEHADFDEYLNCKVAFLKQCKCVFLYRNSEYYDYIRNELKDKEIYTFGDTEDCDYCFSDLTRYSDSTSFKVFNKIKNETKEYKIAIKGDFNVINATASIGVANYLGVDYKSILNGLLKTWVIGRMNIYEGKCTVIVDYAHNKISVQALLDTLRKDYPNKNIKLVFGCPGDRGVNRRKDVGELAGKYASYIYLTAEDPQTKKIKDICDEIISYIEPYNTPYVVEEDREKAIRRAIDEANSDDVIAIIGKGDETYQIVNGEYVPYKSDIVVVEEALNLVTEK